MALGDDVRMCCECSDVERVREACAEEQHLARLGSKLERFGREAPEVPETAFFNL